MARQGSGQDLIHSLVNVVSGGADSRGRLTFDQMALGDRTVSEGRNRAAGGGAFVPVDQGISGPHSSKKAKRCWWTLSPSLHTPGAVLMTTSLIEPCRV